MNNKSLIIDAFPYNSEESILEIRLEEMFKNAPEPEYNVDLIQNHYISF